MIVQIYIEYRKALVSLSDEGFLFLLEFDVNGSNETLVSCKFTLSKIIEGIKALRIAKGLKP